MVYKRLKEDDTVTINGTYHLTREHLYDESALGFRKMKKMRIRKASSETS